MMYFLFLNPVKKTVSLSYEFGTCIYMCTCLRLSCRDGTIQTSALWKYTSTGYIIINVISKLLSEPTQLEL